MSCPLATERVWVDKSKYHDAEKDYFEHLSKLLKGGNTSSPSNESIVNAIIDDSSSSNSANIMESNVTTIGTNTTTTTTTSSNNSKMKKNKKIKAIMSNAGEAAAAAAAVGSPVISESNSTAVTAAMMMTTTMTTISTEEKSRHHSHSEASVASSSHDHHHGKRNESGTRKDNNTNKNEEVKTKKKKKKKNNKETSVEKVAPPLIDAQLDKNKEDSLKRHKSTAKTKTSSTNQCALVSEIAKARQHIKNSLERMDGIAALAASPITGGTDVLDRLAVLEKENASLRELVESLKKCCLDTQKRVQTLEGHLKQSHQPQQQQQKPSTAAPQKKTPAPTANSADEDDGVDLFGSDSEEDEEANAIREKRLADYNAKKAKKPVLIAKSSVVLDIKPWDDETDLGKMEQEIRKITLDGLLWGASKLQPVAFGIKKLVLSCVVEDEKVSIDWLTEEIEKLDDYVQSVDVAAFNKI